MTGLRRVEGTRTWRTHFRRRTRLRRHPWTLRLIPIVPSASRHTHTHTQTHTHTHIRTHMHAYQLRERRTHLSMSLPPCLPRPFPPSPLSPPLSLPVFPFLAHGMTGGWHTNMRALTQTRTIMTANTYDNALANTYSNDGKHVR